MFSKFERKTDVNGRKRLHCNVCRRNTIHTLEAECIGRWDDEDHGGGQEFCVYRCGACDVVCYETASWRNDEYDHDEDGELYVIKTYIQFPPPSSESFAFDTEYAPEGLENLIEEMMYAFAGVKLVLATIGIRLVIEFIVNDKKCAGSNLANKIDDLHAQGHIDEDQKKLLHKIRQRGNAGAHAASPMSKKELVAGMGVVQLLLERLYNGPGRHERLMAQAQRAFKDTGTTT